MKVAQLRAVNEELHRELLRRRPPELRVIAAPVPATRAECRDAPRPCQAYLCRHHLWLADERPGRPYDGRPPAAVVQPFTHDTCALDVAERQGEGLSQEKVGEVLGIVGERVRQIEERAMDELRLARPELASPTADPIPWRHAGRAGE
jgi:hypothetical protein